MPAIHDLLPDGNALLALEPEQLGGYLLEYLNGLPPREQEQLNRDNFFVTYANVEGYPPALHEQILRALMEAWVWLEREGLLAPKPRNQGQWQFITRRGKRLKGSADVEAMRRSNLLPRGQLHPVIASAVWGEFLAGRYDSAVFNAFREVEVAVRAAGKFTKQDYGDDLMRKAFNENIGPLSDLSTPKGERLAVSHLFAGAFGCFRNPTGHRKVGLGATEASETIALASLLMRLVDDSMEQKQ